MSKVIKASEAAKLIKDGDTVAFSGFGLACVNEEMAIAVEKRFLEEGAPRNLTVMHASALGDRREKGMSHWGHEGLIKRWIGGIAIASPKMAKLIEEDKCEAYNLPQGVITQLYREIAAKRPGVITKIGMGTFVDPRIEGAKMSASSKDNLVELLTIHDEEWLFYPSFPIQVALIRGTVADEFGNLTLEKEGLHMEVLPIAQAVRNSGGIVIAQVESVAKKGSLNPKDVRVPGILVDHIIISEPENHFQTENTQYNPAFSGHIQVPLGDIEPLALDDRKVIARRSAAELEPQTILNLGVGIPVNVSTVAAEEGVSDQLILTTEAGSVGGVPAGLADFGHAYNSEAIVDHHSQFDFYDGGGLDLSVLGLAQTDESGNVNVSKFGSRVAGCGGFINISQSAKKLIFAGTFTAGGLKTRIADGKLEILQEGKAKKFIKQVQQITFSGEYASTTDQIILYVTERAVFRLENGKMVLTEIAPGVDLEKDILGQMEFEPIIASDLKVMDSGMFSEQWGGLKAIIEKQTREGVSI
ncbi:acyl CoA:acetate/3-ketoacid CoA transferase [Listeria monocytogenes]|uniref:acyl CoA:acetate/3-ketoacid CoA transferase n=1 Tax=Listeria monocytogenes TaxID=1639 RepID=UPI0010B64818|nr:acyl CoA:acetate/3-ketoacid CoA transferase [Listeria monocytogenes]EAD0701304.1 acyl CoA:acetate/3-ketoacid CoA transferase [Listeria monocytogenes]EAD1462048.1 acyl CoA:acetate/3-ketoacid CoA transferase [Listeria monocytogenes]EAE1473687.1 acyl CoA:acetate/3-ketoacid CoA transferase [Listeria monocytogenes]TYU41364.1 acyl CoA:acetate/3-ketoacid CoA transferase [Listeria monocytogenes]